MSKRRRVEGTEETPQFEAWAQRLVDGGDLSAQQALWFQLLLAHNNLKVVSSLVEVEPRSSSLPSDPGPCGCGNFAPELAIGHDYDKAIVCGHCGQRCPCCDALFTTEYYSSRHDGEGVCCRCAHGYTVCTCPDQNLSESESD